MLNKFDKIIFPKNLFIVKIGQSKYTVKSTPEKLEELVQSGDIDEYAMLTAGVIK